ncbi:MAG TPA: tRNA lysidine(34) synthetase TilS [Lachnospiraceae bacterium]|nr:tRNA lysidine(34) synthetase TilS [Lachnospiraceae bacterium]
MIQKVIDYCRQKEMIVSGDHIVLGISGGADSVCLLFLLHEIKKQIPFDLVAVHINHGIRDEAKADGDFVKSLCENLQVPFFLFEEKIEDYAKLNKLSVEEAGREVRYSAFFQVLNQQFGGQGKVAIAHNKNDRAETVLFHLFRGTGLKGLSGIASVRQQIIRPLLCIERNEIETYLNQNKIAYCIDKTNHEDTYTRNRIRHHILSYAELNICENVVSHISDAASIVEETELFLQKLTKEAYSACVTFHKKEQFMLVQVELFLLLDVLIQKYVIMLILHELTKGSKDITSIHIENIRLLFNKQVGKRVDLPYALVAIKQYDTLCVKYKNKDGSFTAIDSLQIKNEVIIHGPGLYHIADEIQLECEIIDASTRKVIPKKSYTKWFDYDKIDKPLVLRTRQSGDFIKINNEESRKSLKDYFINEKVPKEQRDKVYLLAQDHHIIWVVGHRISQHYKVDDKTKRIFQVRYRGGVKDD